ncbi:hypothetical protein K1719_016155 [Acacia pycnantha]|nr:hypothetical protein K1719_016155 [Acacia pycnantha]
MVSWRQEYDNGEAEKQSVSSYKVPLTKTRIPSLTKFESKKEAYRKNTPDNMRKPPRSTLALLQEEYAHDPWKVVAICMLLNRVYLYMDDTWTHITELHGVGRYAADAYAIFCTGSGLAKYAEELSIDLSQPGISPNSIQISF